MGLSAEIRTRARRVNGAQRGERIASTPHADAPCFSKTTVIAIRATVPSACSTGVFTQAGDGETPELITPAKPAQ
jgi:hypothetical protein